MIESLLVKTYVNCVKFLNEQYVLASAGNLCQVYDVNISKLITNLTIFKSQRIHGIVVNDGKVLFFGGFNLALVQILKKENHINLKIISEWTTIHWIQDVSFFDDDHYAVLGSTNVLYLYKYDTNKGILMDKTEHCREKSVLYSGKILGSTWSNAVVLCGTVFSQVTIWSPMIENSNIFHRLIGHTGVIFSVTYHEGNQTICSTSDDRSLRMWKVEMERSDNTVENWHHAKITLVYSIFGHTARVWRNLQLNNGQIISIGEDGQLKVWWKDTCVHYWNTHLNGNVWSMDYNETSQLIVTGGGDGGVCVWPLSANEITEPNQLDINLSSDDFPRQVVMTNSEKLLIYTNCGTVLSYESNNSKVVLEDRRFRSYCILALSKTRQHYSTASISGDILIFAEDTDEILCEYKACNTKIFSLHWLENNKFVICKPQGQLSICRFDNQNKTVHDLQSLLLPECKERWLTSAVVAENLLICGDRDGSIHIYDLKNEHLKKTYHKIHSRLGVSCIEYNASARTIMSIGRDGFLRHWEIKEENTGGTTSLYTVNEDKLPLEWPVHIVPIGVDTYIIGFHEALSSHLEYSRTKITRPAIVQSFHRDEINSLQCVQIGRERILLSGGEDNTLRISSISQTKENLMNLQTKLILRSHISSIRCLNCVTIGQDVYIVSGGGRAQLKIWKLSSNEERGRDTVIPLVSTLLNCSSLETDRVITNEMSASQDHLTSNETNASGNTRIEERNPSTVKYQCKEILSHMLNGEDRKEKSWKLVQPRINPETRYMDIALLCQGKDRIYIATACSDGFVRIFLYLKEEKKLSAVGEYDYHGKCVLRVHFVKYENQTLLCSMSTNGDLALWNFEQLIEHNPTASFIKSNHCKNVPANEKSIGSSFKQEEKISSSQKENPKCKVKIHPLTVYNDLHQGGINSFDSRVIGAECYLLTGGDDCSLVLSIIRPDLTTRERIEKRRAHNSQITGVKFLDDERIVSTSVDQQIIVWSWKSQEFVKLSQHESCIPDIHGLDVTSDGLIVVYGCGVNIVEVRNEIEETR
ncbi:hypothetical protein WDU94_011287 [Cyamophila willieti]